VERIRRYLSGARLLFLGVGLSFRRPHLFLLGLIPVIIAAVIFIGLFVLLLVFIDDLAGLVTWFADDWSESGRTLVRVVAGIAILGLAVVIGVLTFTQFTLLIGDPWYERISREVEAICGGGVTEVEVGFWRSLRRDLFDSLRLLALTVPIGVCLFIAGFLPFIGQIVVPVLAATVTGWFLALELVGVPFSRRGLRLADRRRAVRPYRLEALGFGTAVFVCFTFIPFGAVLFMPAAVIGGTLLARRVLGLPGLDRPATAAGR
jgi:CysZ protein